MKNAVHSRREERNAAEVAARSRELSARPSIAAQKEVKKSISGDDFGGVDDARIDEGIVDNMITIVG